MLKHKVFSVILPSIFIFLTIVNFLWHTYNYRNDIFAKFDHNYWQTRYEQSQWFVKNSKNPIGDDGLYAYVGYAYITGKDPTLLNAELPPFGKYVIGLFEITTGVMGGFSLFFTCFSLVLLYIFSKMVFKSNLIASITTLLFSLEPIYIEQMRAPYLDALYLCLFLLTSLFFIKEKYLISGICLGLFMSVKPPFFAAILLVVYGVCLLLQKKNTIKPLLWIIISAGVVYIATYLRMFLLGHNLIDFLKVQKYIIHFYSIGAKAVIGAVFPMLFQGKWPTWFGPTLKVTEWTYLWPMSIVGSIVATGVITRDKKRTTGLLFHSVWIIGYLVFLIITPLFPRYLLLLLPFMYNLLIWLFLKSISLRYSSVLSS